jgi:uncharacterized SAM-binding protein YcdF (DUF218 family)
VAALATLGFLVLLVTFTPLVNWWADKLAGPWYEAKGDTLIVLGGSVLDNGLIGQDSYWRGMYAVLAYQSGGFRHIVVSGGVVENPVSVAIEHFLVCSGVPADIIRTERESRSTRENALDTARLLAGDGSRKVLLTSDYHMYRASRAFAKVGLQVIPSPFPDALKTGHGWIGRWPVFLELCRETIKIAYYYARGWI